MTPGQQLKLINRSVGWIEREQHRQFVRLVSASNALDELRQRLARERKTLRQLMRHKPAKKRS
jgi:hypothetical protein